MKKFKMLFVAIATLMCGLAYGQNITVKGVVTDSSTGEPLSGAAILVKGTPQGVVADNDGAYSIVVSPDATLGFTTIGFKEQEVAVNGRLVINVALEPDMEMLAETIVVAFGTTTKEAFTGSASVMRSEDLEKRQVTNVTNALVGSVPGLQMRGASGSPGGGAGSVNIRGIASMYAATDPLVIVDGAPYTASLSNIPQEDIESVTVLKDAASAALYGSRGAAGVILITTKKGSSRDAVVNFDARVGFNQKAVPNYDMTETPGEYYEAYYAQVYNYYTNAMGYSAAEANLAANKKTLTDLGYNVFTLPEGEYLIGLNGKLNPNATLGRSYKASDGNTYYVQPDNWEDIAYKTALRQEYNVSVTGGTDRASFYASMGYLDEDGIIEYSGYKRFSARIKADYQAKKWLKVGANVGFVNTHTDSNPGFTNGSWGSTNLLYYTQMIAPIYPVYVRILDPNGNPIIKTDANGNPQYDYGVAATNYPGLNRAFLQTGNPIGSNRYNHVYSDGNQLNGNFTADFNITSFLKANVTSTVIWGQTNSSDYETGLYGPKVGVNGQIDKGSSKTFRTNNVQTLTYYDTFGSHDINVLLGHEYYDTKTTSLSATAQGLFSPDIQEINAAATKTDSASSTSEYNVEGFFASAQYNYAQKYYASASFRRDASSYFAKERRWGNFWSVGGAWIMSKENFMSSAMWIDQLKLKASIGQQGNDGIGSWAYTDLYSLSKATETSMSPSFSRMGNDKITWETTTNFNVGVEFSFWQGRFSGNIDGYYKKTKDLLFWLSVPESAGTRGYYGNVGDIANKGVELVLNGTLVRTADVDWNITLNASHNVTKILSLPEAKIKENGGFVDTFWYEVGGPLNNYFNYRYAGVSEEGKALYYYDIALSDLNENNETNNIAKPGTELSGTTDDIGHASRYALGSTLPAVFGGFGTSFRWKNFDLSVTFDYQLGGKITDNRYASTMTPATSATDAGSKIHSDWKNAWSPSNPTSNIPRWQYGDTYAAYSSDRFLVSASYLNFQSFAIGYNFPVKKWGFKNVSKIRIYAMGENLGFWSARKGLDPRYSFSSTNTIGTYALTRTISGGIQLTF